MQHTVETRIFASRYLDRVTLTRFAAAGETLIQPDNCWDIVVFNRDGAVQVLRTGLTTRPDVVEHEAGDEILTISFRPDTFMSLLPGETMRNKAMLLDRFGRRDIRIGADVREIPTFDNADVFVERLVRDGIVESNSVVASIVERRPKAMSERTMQRHFLKTTGLTYKHFTVIQRAQEATSLLRTGRPAADVAFALGYSDQAHMINSLKRTMGQTPGEIVRAAPT